MEPIQPSGNFAGVNPPATTLEAKHSDQDILDRCPRDIIVMGHRIVQRAFFNSEYSTLAQIILLLGFMSVCRTEQDVDTMTIDDIFNNVAYQRDQFGADIGANSLEEFLYNIMEFPKGVTKPDFKDAPITQDDYKSFLAIVIEQNNMMKMARIHAKKKLEVFRLLEQARSGNQGFTA